MSQFNAGGPAWEPLHERALRTAVDPGPTPREAAEMADEAAEPGREIRVQAEALTAVLAYILDEDRLGKFTREKTLQRLAAVGVILMPDYIAQIQGAEKGATYHGQVGAATLFEMSTATISREVHAFREWLRRLERGPGQLVGAGSALNVKSEAP